MDKLDIKLYDNFKYDAKVIDVYDGDTITCIVDLGFGITMKQKIRFYGIDTFEIRGEEREKGLIVKDYVKNKINNKKIKLYSIKDKKGKYGRYLGIILYYENNEWKNLNKELVDKNYANLFMI